jgi:hypothetical protein
MGLSTISFGRLQCVRQVSAGPTERRRSYLYVGYIVFFLSNTKQTTGGAELSPPSTAVRNEHSYTSTLACL